MQITDECLAHLASEPVAREWLDFSGFRAGNFVSELRLWEPGRGPFVLRGNYAFPASTEDSLRHRSGRVFGMAVPVPYADLGWVRLRINCATIEYRASGCDRDRVHYDASGTIPFTPEVQNWLSSMCWRIDSEWFVMSELRPDLERSVECLPFVSRESVS